MSNYKINWELPNRLGLLAQRLTSLYGVDAHTLMNLHTFSPYYAVYLPVHLRTIAEEAILGNGLGIHKIFRTLSYMRIKKSLCFCVECNLKMKADCGELYWRRDLQLPLVFVCPLHGCLLCSAQIGDNSSFYGFSAANKNTCPDNAKTITTAVNGTQLATLQEIALRSTALLYAKAGSLQIENYLEADFKGCLNESGLRLGTVAWLENLRTHIYNELKIITEIIPWLFAENGACGVWLERALTRNPMVFDPAFHILLQMVLDRSCLRTIK